MIATHTRNVRWMIVPAVVLSFGLLGARCGGGGFQVTLDTPSLGDFITSANVTVSGSVNAVNPQLASLTVNGISVLPVGPGGAWSLSLPLDQAAIFNTILVEGIRTNGKVSRRVVTVHYGEHIDDGDLSPMGVALRINDGGLNDVEGLVTELVDFDPSTLIPIGTVVLDECVVDSFLGCLGSARVTVVNPPPSITGFGIDMDAITNAVAGDVLITNLNLHLDINGSGLVPSCPLTITATTTNIDGDYALTADANDEIDVNLIGGVGVSFGDFNDNLGGICDVPIIGDIIQLFLPDIQSLFTSGFQTFLNDPDGGGPADAPIAEAVEVALAEIEISGPIGQSLGVNLETPLFDVFEDTAGITLDSDARITALMPDPNAVDILATYHVQEVFPTYGATSPVLGSPYDMAIGISTSAFNQLLKAEVESGLLITTVSEIAVPPLIPNPVQITAGLLGLLVPQFSSLPSDLELHFDIKPLLSPIVTGETGPGGEIADLRIGGLQATVRGENTVTYLTVFVNARVGLDIDFAGGELSFVLGTPTANDVEAFVELNPLGANPTTLEQDLLPALVASALPELASSLGTFPLPAFLGFDLSLVEIAKSGEFMSLFLNLDPAP